MSESLPTPDILTIETDFINEFHTQERGPYISFFKIEEIDGEKIIVVGLRDRLPQKLSLPTKYRGVRVITK